MNLYHVKLTIDLIIILTAAFTTFMFIKMDK